MATATAPGSPVPGGAGLPAPRWSKADTVRTGVALAVAAALVAGAVLLAGLPGQGPDASFSLLVGAALGIVCERGRFCFYCIFRDLFEHRDSTGVYAILTALAVGAVGYTIVFTIFLPDPGAGQLPPGAHIGPVSWTVLLAGAAFGLGIVLSGGCIGGHLYRLAEGSLRSVPALLSTAVGFGIGFATWNTLYVTALSGAPTPWLPQWLGYPGALAVTLGALAVPAVLLLRRLPPRPARSGGALTPAEIGRAVFVRRWPTLTTGALVGIIGVIAYLRVEPLGVTRQIGSATRTLLDGGGLLPSTVHGLDTFAGCATVVATAVIDNGWLILGLVAGALAAGLPGGHVRWERPTGPGVAGAVLGGLLLGWGAMTAIGCTFGVLLSGTQAFALSGWVFGAGVVGALWAGFRLRLHQP